MSDNTQPDQSKQTKYEKREAKKVKQELPEKAVGNKPTFNKEVPVEKKKKEVKTEKPNYDLPSQQFMSLKTAADSYRSAYKKKATDIKNVEATKTSFIKNIKSAFKYDTLTQQDVDYISNLFLHEEEFSELNLVLGLNNQRLVDVIIYWFAKLNNLKITIVNLPINERHVSKIRKV
jgi:hypothetical protein